MDKKIKNKILHVIAIIPIIILIWSKYFELTIIKILMTIYIMILTYIFKYIKRD